jgi:hypothetical protein
VHQNELGLSLSKGQLETIGIFAETKEIQQNV